MNTITPTAATFRQIADLINREELPPAAITVSENNRIISVNTTGTDRPEGDLRRWAQALGVVVYAPYLHADRSLDGVFWTLYAFVPVEARSPEPVTA